jgi:hypothetical protein
MKFIKSVAAAFLGSVSLAAGQQNIIEVATSNDFNTLVAAIDAAGLTDALTASDGAYSKYSHCMHGFILYNLLSLSVMVHASISISPGTLCYLSTHRMNFRCLLNF